MHHKQNGPPSWFWYVEKTQIKCAHFYTLIKHLCHS